MPSAIYGPRAELAPLGVTGLLPTPIQFLVMSNGSSSQPGPPALEQQISELPVSPGVYMMKDARNEVLYVGKAKNLRNRVRTYFQEGSTDTRPYMQVMLPRVVRIDHVVTGNEREALILENNLIKQFKPKFNIRLKDDKTYMSIEIDLGKDFPRPVTMRQRKRDQPDVLYFGPYSSAAKTRSTLRYLNRVFPIRECSDYVLAHRTRPCPLYEMGRCTGPCVGKVSKEDYQELIDEVLLVLKGNNEELTERLNEKMLTAAQGLRFEDAGRYRDQIQAIQHTAEQQRIDSPDLLDRDVFAYHLQGDYLEIQALFVRGGRLEDLASHSFRVTDRSPEEVFCSFLNLFYTQAPIAPEEVLLPIETEDAAPLAEHLSERRGKKVRILCPKRGRKARLVELARANAENSYKIRHGKSEANRQVLNALQADLKLRNRPTHIECFDISNIGGELAVGSMVTFRECVPDKSAYRHFKIRTVSQSDDFAMMYEVLKRWYAGAAEQGELPDLTIIDGGKGQLSVATRVFGELGITTVDVIGLAKSRRREKSRGQTIVTDERVFKPELEEPIVLAQDSPHLLYLTRIRDEAHRFAINYHRKLRQKEYQRRGLTAIPGVGDVLRKRLLRRFGSAAGVRQAPVEELASVEGVSERLARTIHQHFHPEQRPQS